MLVLQRSLHPTKQLIRAAQNNPAQRRRGVPKLDSKTILVIDEAGMLGTRDLHEILTEALQVGCKVVMMGDPRQIQPIELGTPIVSLSA